MKRILPRFESNQNKSKQMKINDVLDHFTCRDSHPDQGCTKRVQPGKVKFEGLNVSKRAFLIHQWLHRSIMKTCELWQLHSISLKKHCRFKMTSVYFVKSFKLIWTIIALWQNISLRSWKIKICSTVVKVVTVQFWNHYSIVLKSLQYSL